MASINWKTGSSGLWSDAADWSTGTVPSASSDVTISVAPAVPGTPYVVQLDNSATVHSLTLDQADAELQIASGTLSIATSLDLQSGEIVGGTIAAADDFYILGNQNGQDLSSTLSDVSVDGTLNIRASYASLTVMGGLAMASSSGSGIGTILLAGTQSSLDFLGTGTLSGALLEIGAGTSNNQGASNSIYLSDLPSGATTLTLASNSTIVQTGYGAAIYGSLDNGNKAPFDTLAINGSLVEKRSGQVMSVGQMTLLNSGSVTVGNGAEMAFGFRGTLNNLGKIAITGVGTTNGGTAPLAQVEIGSSAALTNFGTITVGTGGLLSLVSGASWTNNGSIAVTGGSLDIGAANTGQLVNINVSKGGSITIDGGATLDNVGATLTVGANSALGTISVQGTIHGGTIIDLGNGIASPPQPYSAYGDLDDVQYQGVLTVGGSNELLGITDGILLTGLNGSGGGSIALTGVGAALYFADKETLGLTNISIGAESTGATLTGNQVTLGAAVVVRQTGANATIGGVVDYQGGTLTNLGKILGGVAGGTLTLAGDFTNAGTIAVSNGDDLLLDTSTLTNTGTISVTNGILSTEDVTTAQIAKIDLVNSPLAVLGTLTATGTTLSVGPGTSLPSLELGGTIEGGTIKDAGGGLAVVGEGVFNGVTYEGTVSINRPLAQLVILNDFTATGFSGSGAGSIALTGAGSELVWGSSATLNNATLTIGNPGLTYEGHAVAAPALVSDNTPLVSLGAKLVIAQSGLYADVGGDNNGALGTAFGTFASAATILAGFAGGDLSLEGASFTSTGTIAISNGDTITEGAANFVNAGQISVGAGSALNLDLYNYFFDQNFAPQSFANANSIALAGGTITELTDGGTFPSTPLLNQGGARISGFGTIQSAITNDGTITAAGGTLSLGQNVTDTGALIVEGGATLSLAGISTGETASFGGTGGVLGLAPASFLGEIGGFAAGDTLDLASTSATAASFSGTSLVVTLSTGSTITLATTTALTGSLTTTAGTDGDTLITFAPSGSHAPVQPASADTDPSYAVTHFHVPAAQEDVLHFFAR